MITFDKGAGFMFIICIIVLVIGSISFNFMHHAENMVAGRLLEIAEEKRAEFNNVVENIAGIRVRMDAIDKKINTLETGINQIGVNTRAIKIRLGIREEESHGIQ